MTGAPAGADDVGAAPGAADEVTVPEVSVVVPYYRAQDDLDRLVAALAVQDHPAARLQLVVADDGSPVPPRLPAGLPFATAVVRHEDRGFRASAARELGVRAAEGSVLAFLDGDMLPEPGYVRAAAAAAATSRDAVVVGRRRHLGEELVEAGWRPGDPVPAEALLPEPAWLTDAYARTDGLSRTDSTAYRFVISAVLTVARDVYEDAGGFDPAFVGYGGEDWELAHRLWRVGGAFRHEPRAVAWQAGGDFAERTDPAEAARVKDRESLVLASRITATTARGRGLSLGGPLRLGARVPVPEIREDGDGDARAGDRQAAAVLCVDAVLQAFPHARVGVTGPLDDAARAVLGDPRVVLLGEPAPAGDAGAGEAGGTRDVHADLPPTPPRGDLAAVRGVPDWSVDVRVPLRPSAPGRRPDPAAADAWLLRLEGAGVERVEVLGEPGTGGRDVLAVLTSSRALWRERRGTGAGRTLRVPAARLGWGPVGAVADLEAWFGGWG